MISRPAIHKIIGLVSRVSGDGWEPTSDTSQERLYLVYEAAGVPKPFAPFVRREELRLVKDLARAAGYTVLTTNKALGRSSS